ncbi:MAG: DNA-protecting protein DprA [Hyphomicrobiales bacterium]|nr:MAG: DNA-protecting protein DprA [Hyphomicrobiales bacterium]
MNTPITPNAGIQLSDQQRVAWLQLIRSENVGPATFRDLINHFGTATTALEALPELASRGNGPKQIKIASQRQAEQELTRLEKLGGRIICLGEPDYPSALLASDGSPPVISVLGSVQTLSRNAVAIVGSRNSSLSGVKLTKIFARDIAKADYVIVSGLARGIDTAAHEASLSRGTVAIFAGGVDHIYPSENKALADQIIAQNGAIISELPLSWKPRAQDFPRRNRIVAGMSLGILVVEAARRSGSLITARLANEMGRLVFAVPGSPLDPRSEGTNGLIKQGALLVSNADDILQALEPLSETNQQASYSLNEEDTKTLFSAEPDASDRSMVLRALNHTPTDIDELIRFTELSASTVQIVLLELALAGRIEHHTGNKVSLI